MGVAANVTVPVGVVGVPASVSVTVAVQKVVPLTPMGSGEQLTDVLVERLLTVSELEPLLPAWLVSPA